MLILLCSHIVKYDAFTPGSYFLLITFQLCAIMKRCEAEEESSCDEGQDQFWKTTEDLVSSFIATGCHFHTERWTKKRQKLFSRSTTLFGNNSGVALAGV